MADRKDQTEATNAPVADILSDRPEAEVIPPDTETRPAADLTPNVSEAEFVDVPQDDLQKDGVSDPADRQPDVEPSAPRAPEKIIERIERRGGFVPMLLGGVAAAAIGFGMARYVLPDDFPFPKPGQNEVATALSQGLTEAKNADLVLASRLEKLEAGPDLSGVTAVADAAKAAADTAVAQADTLAQQYDELAARVSDLATRPVTEGAGPAAVAAYEVELAKLQAAMAEQRASLEGLLTEATAQRDAAQMTEQDAMVRNSITRIRIALENGGPFVAELTNLSDAGIDVPATLTDRATTGVPTVPALRAAYPDAARAALAAARAGNSPGGVGSVLTSLLGARSLEPRDGDDPDAILSRTEAALRDGRVSDAIAEAETLPEAAKTEMAGWLQLAGERATALAALDALAAQATAN